MWRGERDPQAFQAPVDVHASADGQVYTFKRTQDESAATSEDEDLSVVEMRQMKQSSSGNVQLLEREVLDGDNLSKLALQYGCKVADIKRVNNLMQEQDLFGLKSIKIPVQKHSFLTESFPDMHGRQEEVPHPSIASVRPLNRGRSQTRLQEATDFLMEMESDIDKLIQTTDQDEDLLDTSDRVGRFGLRRRRLIGHGADWGIQWWNAVVAMLLIGIVLPLFYVIYFKTKGNGVVPPADGALQFSTSSSNTSGTGLGTKGLEQFEEPG
ncbi:lysM and putative peptidoglycan-binding domain-containing protein 4 [Cololabis saira]|uniref:lysM and putative peptidoglycan-binding domain-containing protein 4 n=1 Tax=Cololabis saira TaxID=129043 RepID=UPI002AD38CA2|nr:lysM and putative peptidoglycan-binding domain-containing protein 4 [Cololabis saira]